MSGAVTVELKNANRLKRQFGEAAARVAGTGLLPALQAGALLVQNGAMERAPYRTGTLRRSIHIESDESSGQPVVLVGTDVVYARRIEYGFIGEDRLGRRYDQSPQPYLRPALDENREAIRREVKTVLTQIVRDTLEA